MESTSGGRGGCLQFRTKPDRKIKCNENTDHNHNVYLHERPFLLFIELVSEYGAHNFFPTIVNGKKTNNNNFIDFSKSHYTLGSFSGRYDHFLLRAAVELLMK